MGQPTENLARAMTRLGEIPDVLGVEASPIYRTEPQLVREQSWFANQVARVICGPQVTPFAFLEELLNLEIDLGRDRTRGEGAPIRYGPRVIDLDLLLFDDVVMQTERLTLPHPGILARAFVLLPLVDLAPDLVLPDGIAIREVLEQLDYRREGDQIWQD
ncbi:2-amino-4-hydroxy-6-hydroxymethyldihydropteridine diphosphokinase [Desulfovibrio ferrophilus]|uniref:2-amino-4-hydroxy-6-hydroxymethyldihydropteridine pyrophosphokinase n=1 Tax=Desulfovibrio ferrophilus TaxID=241368 RepID=A0A2Z6AWQ7_9BACT|nr:2-amino-4-hydroxy-6-hydroxymethyldihydropteridine diphosphokinase [Desulfovibrio ferrophilus]BBD07687.1 2-amino-4-hydroxy-6-hydroxymethyldihydropteridine pyrophosphokinase [Desulfovibrio ferrophilus]